MAWTQCAIYDQLLLQAHTSVHSLGHIGSRELHTIIVITQNLIETEEYCFRQGILLKTLTVESIHNLDIQLYHIH